MDRRQDACGNLQGPGRVGRRMEGARQNLQLIDIKATRPAAVCIDRFHQEEQQAEDEEGKILSQFLVCACKIFIQ